MSEIFWDIVWGLFVFGILTFVLMLGIVCISKAYEKDVARVVARIKGEK